MVPDAIFAIWIVGYDSRRDERNRGVFAEFAKQGAEQTRARDGIVV